MKPEESFPLCLAFSASINKSLLLIFLSDIIPKIPHINYTKPLVYIP